MKRKHSTKRALIASVLSLALCFSMLIGTTYAWFTDSVTSSGNVIKSGTLDIEFKNYDYNYDNGDNTKGAWVKASESKIFNYENWEPGYTQKVNLSVTNKGSLALKWMAAITTEENLSILADVIYVYVRANDGYDNENDIKGYIDGLPARANYDAEVAAGNLTKCTLREFITNCSAVTKGTLESGKTAYLGLILQMDPEAGNEYQNLDLGGKFDITVLATQMTYEKDSIDENYDANAKFPHFTTGTLDVVAGTSEYEIPLMSFNNQKLGSAVIPGAAVADDAEKISATVKTVPTASDFTAYNADSQTVTSLDVTVTGLKKDNNEEVEITTYIPTGLTGVKLFHKSVEMDPAKYSYDPADGSLIFWSASFSPFHVVYDTVPAEAVVPGDKPMAIVTKNPGLANTPITWNDDLGLLPSNENQALEAVYTFKAPHNSETVLESGYAGWYCDFYVMCSADTATIPEGALVLGGNYGDWGWIGFDNPEVDANVEIPLLGSVTQNPWTYEQVVDFVETFTCGVAHNNHALDGETFTVILRLTNPNDENDVHDAAKITYTFPNCAVSTVDELEDALENGGNIVLADNIELNKTLMANNDVVIDLNGKAITAPSNSAMFQSQSNAAPSMIITSSTAGAEINVAGGDISVLLGYGSTVIENVTINVTGCDNSSPNPFKVYGDLTLGEGTVVNVDFLGTALISNNGAADVVIDGAEINIGTFKTNGTAIITLNAASTLEIKNTKITIGTFVLSPFGGDSLVSKTENVTIENCAFDVTDSNGASCTFEAKDNKVRLVQK